MPQDRLYVVLIGVSHYPRWPDLILHGAVDDARRWRELATDRLGVAPENLRLHTSTEAEGERSATSEAILDSMRWLGERMTEAPGAALCVFCGHGATAQNTGLLHMGLTTALCTADLERDAAGVVQGTLTVAALVNRMGGDEAPAWLRDVTLVLDCCYSPVHGLRPSEGKLMTGSLPVRGILACDPLLTAYRLFDGDSWRGALSYALLTLLGQWTVERADGLAWSRVTAQTLVQRSAALLGLLGLTQQPLYIGPPRAQLQPFLRPGLNASPSLSAINPDLPRPTEQIDAGWSGFRAYKVSVTVPSAGGADVSTTVALVVVPGAHGGPEASGSISFDPGREYWYMLEGSLTAADVQAVTSIALTCVAKDAAYSGLAAILSGVSASGVTPVKFSGYGSFQPNPATPPSGVTATARLTAPTACSPLQGLSLGFTIANGKSLLSWMGWYASSRGPTRFLGALNEDDTATFTVTLTDSTVAGWSCTTALSTSFGTVTTATSGSTGQFLLGMKASYMIAAVDANGDEGPCKELSGWVDVHNNTVSGMLINSTALPANASWVQLYRRTLPSDKNVGVMVTALGAVPVSPGGTLSFLDE